jgi:hypothetical protein
VEISLKVPAYYPDPGNPGYYMNVFKTPTTLNDGQQQPVIISPIEPI